MYMIKGYFCCRSVPSVAPGERDFPSLSQGELIEKQVDSYEDGAPKSKLKPAVAG